MKTRNYTELEIIGARTVLKKLFPRETFFYCDEALCSTEMANIGAKEKMAISYVLITENGVLFVVFENNKEEEERYIIRDIHDTPTFVKIGE